MKIGNRLRELRQDSGLTLEELSNKSGIALATLSRMENDKMTGTIESHIKLCKALGIALPRLYSGFIDDESGIDVQRDDNRTEVFVHNKKCISEMLTRQVLKKKIMPVLLKIEPDGITDKEENKIGTEKFIYILEGDVEITINNKKYNLTKGDTLYFNASLPHQFKNTGNKDVECICIVSPPTL